MSVNLDEAAAKRAPDQPEVIFKGVTFHLPPEPDGRILEVIGTVARATVDAAKDPNAMATAADAITDFCKLLLGDEWDRFAALEPSLYDLMALAEAFPELYEMEPLGESLASPKS